MAYCNNCGAYIPDGQGICLACGYDPAAAAAKAEAAAAQQSAAEHQSETSQNNEEMRRKLEEQRRRAREQNLKWAEEQKKRREEQAAQEAARKEQQEKEREWARQEYERRKAEQQAQQQSSAAAGQHYYGSAAAGAAASSGEGNKALAALSYISFLFILPGILTPQDEFARFHARQGLKLFIFGIIADILISAAGLGFLVWIARIYLAVKGISNAINGRKEPLPYIGTIGGT